MSLYRLLDAAELREPRLVAALDGWVDAGAASTMAADRLAGQDVVATFDGDVLFDYRSRRPTLEIIDGRLGDLTWPELSVRRASLPGRDGSDLLVLTGAEPDYRWRELADAVVDLVSRLGVVEWISLGAIPAAVPHTRPVPVLGTASGPGLLPPDVPLGPVGVLRVPSAALSVVELAVTASGVPAVGFYAQVPHYLSGPYPAAAVELLRMLGRHVGVEPPIGVLAEEARQLGDRLDAAAAADETTRTYVRRLEAMVDEERLPTGEELISDIERFLRERGGAPES